MITNKDLSIDNENGKITLNGNKYDLGTQGEIDTAVKDVYSVMGEMGAKNLIPYPYVETTKTVNGVTFTDNGDGTITVSTESGGATGVAQFGLVSRTASDFYLPNGVYTVTGCPQITGCQIRVGRTVGGSDSQYGQDTGNGLTFTREDAANPIGIALQIASGTIITTPITFKPMLRLASDTDNTYEPYAMTNKQLTEQVADVKGTIGDLTQTGATGATVAAQISNFTKSTLSDNIELTSGVEYTAPTDGYLFIVSDNTAYSTAYIGGSNMIKIKDQDRVSLFMRKGMTVTPSLQSGSSAIFKSFI